jgi:hypothetical protein
MQPTPVHLQVYDGMLCSFQLAISLSKFFSFIIIDVGHVLPILFPFTTPGKYCYRAVALFMEYVTKPPEHSEIHTPQASSRPNLYRSLTSGISRAASNIKRRSSLAPPPTVRTTSGQALTLNDSSPSTSGYVTPQDQNVSVESLDASSPGISGGSEDQASEVRAGEAKVYECNWVNILSLNLLYTETTHRPQVPLIGI